jgi:protein-S-isoprenylcysteine O-methyltransferase Ste14
MMVYTSYALLAQHWLPWIVLAYWWLSVFLVNMIMAESSLSRYPDWKNYKKKTSFLIPGII